MVSAVKQPQQRVLEGACKRTGHLSGSITLSLDFCLYASVGLHSHQWYM